MAMLKKVAMDIARSGSEGFQGLYRVGGGRGLPPPPSTTIALAIGKGWARKLMYIKLPMY